MICFNPLPSQEGRQEQKHCPCLIVLFQSTPFARRETCIVVPSIFTTVFQSTPFARRETGCRANEWLRWRRFNPLPSQEGRHYQIFPSIFPHTFQSTPFARRETYPIAIHCYAVVFQSTPFARRETRHGK